MKAQYFEEGTTVLITVSMVEDAVCMALSVEDAQELYEAIGHALDEATSEERYQEYLAKEGIKSDEARRRLLGLESHAE